MTTTVPLAPHVVMPADHLTTVIGSGGIDAILRRSDADAPGKSMAGFDPAYRDIVDYIVRITHRIWEQGDVGYINETYSPDVVVTDGASRKAGRSQMIEETLSALAAFPDIRLYADEVVWAGDDSTGFHTSHRVVTVGRNTGAGPDGPPTGRLVHAWSFANCIVRNNRIVEEWLQENTGLVLRQLGHSPIAVARRAADALSAIGAVPDLAPPTSSESGPDSTPQANELGGIDTLVRSTLHRLWNRRDLSALNDAYTPNVRFHGPTGREGVGRGDVRAYVLSLLAMFPDLQLRIDDLYWRGSDELGYAIAVRWSVQATHSGAGIYGPPTGRPVRTWGISHFYVRNRSIVEEWSLFNEFEVMRDLFTATVA